MKNTTDTLLPNNFLAEQAILNLLLTTPLLVKEVVIDLKIESFYFEPHKLIYQTICQIYDKNGVINLTTVITNLQDKGILKETGGIQRIITIISGFENFSDLDDYVRQVNDKYLRRLIIEVGKQIITWGYTTSEDLEVILDKMEQSIFSLNQQKLSQKIYSAAEIMDEVFNEMKAKIKKTAPPGLTSSFKDLDSIIQGFQKSDLIIIAGRPSMGKTAFSLNLGKNIVEKYNVPLLIFTLEMSRQQIIYRFIATDSNINANRLKSGKMTPLEWKSLGSSMKKISELPIFIDDNPNLTLVDIRSKLRKIFTGKVKNGLIIIDYLQLMKLSSKMENRVQEISHITRNLKILAKEFEVPFIVLSQLSRNVESRTNKRPMLSDLRESGCLASLYSNNETKLQFNDKYLTLNLEQEQQVKRKKSFYSQLEYFPIKSKLWEKPIKSWNQMVLVNENLLIFDFKGVKPTFLIVLTNGIKICLTSNHRILSKKGWVRAFQLKKETEIYFLIKNKKDLEYAYLKVKDIFYKGINKVYDKTIPTFHNYLTKNIVLHNSIEQDSDIVIMIYREEYYTQEKNSDSQITEFIVAKHRNGPIGTAKLLFKPSVTSFTNI